MKSCPGRQSIERRMQSRVCVEPEAEAELTVFCDNHRFLCFSGIRGVQVYKLHKEVRPNYRLKCLWWLNNQLQSPRWSWGWSQLSCPCSWQQGLWDFRFWRMNTGDTPFLSFLPFTSPTGHHFCSHLSSPFPRHLSIPWPSATPPPPSISISSWA